MSVENLEKERKYKKWITLLGIIIPLAVAVLSQVKLQDFGIEVEPLTFLPPIYATINGITAVLLIVALIAIKNKKVVLHENLMTTAIWASVVFLVMYVVYHLTSDSTKFGDVDRDGVLSAAELAALGTMRYIYFFILITHILLSIVIIPLVLITYVRAISGNFERHKKIAKITFPLWLYVAVTGVVVYIMISPYY